MTYDESNPPLTIREELQQLDDEIAAVEAHSDARPVDLVDPIGHELIPLPNRELELEPYSTTGISTRCWCGEPMYRVIAVKWLDESRPIEMITACQAHTLEFQEQYNRSNLGVAGTETWDMTTALRYERMGAKGVRIGHFATEMQNGPVVHPAGRARPEIPDDTRLILVGKVIQAVAEWADSIKDDIANDALLETWDELKTVLDQDEIDTSKEVK